MWEILISSPFVLLYLLFLVGLFLAAVWPDTPLPPRRAGRPAGPGPVRVPPGPRGMGQNIDTPAVAFNPPSTLRGG
jgi:hypothetical protein